MPKISSEIAIEAVVHSMLTNPDNHGKAVINQLTKAYPDAAIRLVASKGVKIHILDKDQEMLSGMPDWWTNKAGINDLLGAASSAGLFLPFTAEMIVKYNSIFADVTLHEFAHALDWALAGGVFPPKEQGPLPKGIFMSDSSERLAQACAAEKKMWGPSSLMMIGDLSFPTDEERKQLGGISAYSTSSVQEFFADAFRMYFNARRPDETIAAGLETFKAKNPVAYKVVDTIIQGFKSGMAPAAIVKAVDA